MAYEAKGVVARSKGAPVTVETIVVPTPGPGEAVVDVQACGVCATDLHYREGNIDDEFPFLLRHEAAGVVSAVEEGGTSRFPLEDFLSEAIGLDDVEDAFDNLRRGEALRSLVVLDKRAGSRAHR
jgi:Zn-dependent alcohol dehydrogenase